MDIFAEFYPNNSAYDQDDLDSLDQYKIGDNLSKIAWKKTLQKGEKFVKKFTGQKNNNQKTLDLDKYHDLDFEKLLSAVSHIFISNYQMNNEIYLIIVFVMAMMLGYELIKKIPPTLHTPLMSGTNAISGIVIIGSILVITSSSSLLINILGFASLLLSSINVFGGFIVTDRMLEMFKKPKNQGKK